MDKFESATLVAEEVRKVFDVDLSELKEIQEFCSVAIALYWCSDQTFEPIGCLQQAVQQIVRMILDQRASEKRSIECLATVEEDLLVFDLIHDGAPLPTDALVNCEPIERDARIFLIEQCIDNVDYRQLSDGRQLIRLEMSPFQEAPTWRRPATIQ